MNRCMKNTRIELSEEDIEFLNNVIASPANKEALKTRAKILLELQKQHKRGKIARKLGITTSTVYVAEKQFELTGVKSVFRKSGNAVRSSFNEEQCAKIFKLSKTKPPEGLPRWSSRTLAKRAMELGYVEFITHESVRKILMDSGVVLQHHWKAPQLLESHIIALIKLSETPPKNGTWFIKDLVELAISLGLIPNLTVPTVRKYIVRRGKTISRRVL